MFVLRSGEKVTSFAQGGSPSPRGKMTDPHQKTNLNGADTG